MAGEGFQGGDARVEECAGGVRGEEMESLREDDGGGGACAQARGGCGGGAWPAATDLPAAV